MQSFTFLLFVCCFLTGVDCNVAAGPFQNVYIYYAYQMEISAHGVGAPNSIAIACRGKVHPDTSCTFDELMKHIDPPPTENRPPWAGPTDIGESLWPDPIHAAQELHNSGYPAVVDNKKLFPNIWPPGSKNPQLGELMSAITDRIQEARRTESDEHFVRELKNAKLALTLFTEARLADLATFRIRGINKALKALGVTWEVDTGTRLGQESSWTDVDIPRTLANHPNEAQRIVNTIKNFETNWLATDKPAFTHDRGIKACQALANRVYGDCKQ